MYAYEWLYYIVLKIHGKKRQCECTPAILGCMRQYLEGTPSEIIRLTCGIRKSVSWP